MGYDKFRISVETLENGYEVEVPDIEAYTAAKAKAEKSSKNSPYPSPYYGDFCKKYAAKSVAEVLKLVKGALEKMPENEFDAAFDEAADSD